MKLSHIIAASALFATSIIGATTPIAHADTASQYTQWSNKKYRVLAHGRETAVQKQLARQLYSTVIFTDADTQRVTPWENMGTAVHDANNNVTYYNAENDPQTRQIYEAAITNWNNLGVIHFVPTNNINDATVVLSDDNDGDTVVKQNSLTYQLQNDLHVTNMADAKWDGITYFHNVNDGTNIKSFIMIREGLIRQINADANADPHIRHNDYQLAVNVATHELGHALGFAHDPYRRRNVSERTIAFNYNRKTKTFSAKYEIDNLLSVNNDAVASPIMASGASSDTDYVIPLGNAEKQTLLKYYGQN